jgi:hypothetical protein
MIEEGSAWLRPRDIGGNMSTNQLKPRPQPKTVEEWRDVRREKYRNAGDYGGFRVLPTKVLDSDAFNELRKSTKLVLIISLSQVDYWHKKHKGLSRRDSSIGPLRNDGRFSLPSNLLKERGIRGTDTIAAARKEIVAAGFWETVETGTLHSTGIFRWSDNWLTYNQKPLAKRKSLDPSSKAPGYCHCPNITEYNEQIKAQKASELDNSSEHQNQEYYISEGNDYVQLELFEELAA